VGACHRCNNWRNAIEMKLKQGVEINHIGDRELRNKLLPI